MDKIIPQPVPMEATLDGVDYGEQGKFVQIAFQHQMGIGVFYIRAEEAKSFAEGIFTVANQLLSSGIIIPENGDIRHLRPPEGS